MKMDSQITTGLRTFHFRSSLLKQTKQDLIVFESSKLMETKGHQARELYGAKRPPRQLHSQVRRLHKRRTSGQECRLVIFSSSLPFFLGLPLLNHTALPFSHCPGRYVTSRYSSVVEQNGICLISLFYLRFV